MPFDSNGIYSLPVGYLAVDGQTILSSQHNPPLEDIQSALSQTLLRSGAAPMSANLNLGGFKLTNIADGSAPQDAASFNQVSAATPPTGMRGEFYLPSAPNGWVVADGNTIGNASSGATRANADTSALFTVFWNSFNNTLLPIYDSSGAASVRGISAAADYAANKRLAVFDDRNLFARGTGFLTPPTGTYQDQSFASHSHGVTDLGHGHNLGNTMRGFGINSAPGAFGIIAQGGSVPGDLNSVVSTSNISIQLSGGNETRPMSRAVLVCIKL